MGSTPKIVEAGPAQAELVTPEILRGVSLNAQAFSGQQNPSTIWRSMVAGYPSIYPYYREVAEKDSAVGAAIETRKRLVMGRERNVIAADAKNTQAVLLQKELAAFHDSIPEFDNALEELLDAPALGFSLLEILWGQGNVEQAWMSPKLIGRPQELFSFGKLYDAQIGALRLSNFPGGEGVEVVPNKFLVATYQPRQGDRRGQPLLRRVYWLSWFKRNTLNLHLKFLEKGPGTIVVQYSDPKDRDVALEVGAAISQETYAAAKEGLKVITELLSSSRIRDAADFQALSDYCDQEITRMLLGQTQTTRAGEGGKGTQALGRVHEATEDEVTRRDATMLENVINEQLDRPWLQWRFGVEALDRAVRPWWTIQKDPPKDAERELRVIAAARNVGLTIPEEEARRASGIRAPEGTEATLPPPALSAAMLGDLSQIPPGQ